MADGFGKFTPILLKIGFWGFLKGQYNVRKFSLTADGVRGTKQRNVANF